MKLSRGRKLKWCEKHDEPLIVYHDGSWSCRWQEIVETSDDTQCKIIPVARRSKTDCECHECEEKT